MSTPSDGSNSRRIVLCGTQRCGSTLVCEDMWNTGVLGRPEEYFIPWNPARSDVDWAEAWVSVRRRGSTPNGVFAVKVMANQLPLIDECFRRFSPASCSTETSFFDHFHAQFRDAAWIYLVRDDIAAQAISRVMARQTGVSHAVARPEEDHFAGHLMRGYRADYNADARFNLQALREAMIATVRENVVWRAFFNCHGIKPLLLRYEDTITDFPGYLYRLAAHAGAFLERDPEARKLVRLSNQLNSEWHAALVEALRAELTEAA